MDGCVCGGFEVVADGLKDPSEVREPGEQELFDSAPLSASTHLYKELSEEKT